MTVSDWVQILVGLGVGGGLIETWRWFFGGGRGKARIDNAKIVEAMALDLLKPLNEQVAWATGQVETLRETLHSTQTELSTVRGQMHRVQNDMEALLTWSLAVKQILDAHGVEYPPTPGRHN